MFQNRRSIYGFYITNILYIYEYYMVINHEPTTKKKSNLEKERLR